MQISRKTDFTSLYRRVGRTARFQKLLSAEENDANRSEVASLGTNVFAAQPSSVEHLDVNCLTEQFAKSFPVDMQLQYGETVTYLGLLQNKKSRKHE